MDPSSLINAERGPRPERDVDVLVILCVVSCPVAAEDFKTPGSGQKFHQIPLPPIATFAFQEDLETVIACINQITRFQLTLV